MIDKTVNDFIKEQIEQKTDPQKGPKTLEEFITDAAKNAVHITCSTHPCQFSHPYANKDKNFRITPVVFFGKNSLDGYVRSGNVKTQCSIDMYGSAGFAPVMKFLTLQMSNGRSVLENIKDNTDEGKELLKASGEDPEEMRKQFLNVFKQSDSKQITSSKIKQVYFSLGNGQYHLLSLLTPSPLVYELKNRISAINSDAIQKKKQIKKGELTEPFKEVYKLTKLKYGGTKPQNISKLNTENGGITRLLHSVPPIIDYKTRIPKRNFFEECLNAQTFKHEFDGLYKLVTLPQNSQIPLEKQRKYRDRLLEEIISSIAEKMLVVREMLSDIPSTLKTEQQIWLNRDENVRADTANGWDNKIISDMANWIISHISRNNRIRLGDAELSAIKEEILNLRELWK